MSNTLRLILKENELLVLQLANSCLVRSLNGRQWLTIDGRDICLDATGGLVTLPAGKLLLEGSGSIELNLAQDPARHSSRVRFNSLSFSSAKGNVPCN